MIYTFGGMTYSRYKLKVSSNFSKFLAKSKNKEILFIDGSTSEFAEKYLDDDFTKGFTNLDVLKLKNIQKIGDIPKYFSRYDEIVINSALETELEESLKISDHFIVPFNAEDLGLWNVWKLTNIERYIYNSLADNPKLQSSAFIVNPDSKFDGYEQFIKRLKESQYLDYIESLNTFKVLKNEKTEEYS